MLSLKPLYTKRIENTNGELWWYECQRDKDSGRLIYTINCIDMSSFNYKNERFLRLSGSRKEEVPDSVKDAFFKEIEKDDNLWNVPRGTI